MERPPRGPNIFSLLRAYLWPLIGMIALSFGANALNLALPKIVASGIDAFTAGTFALGSFSAKYLGIVCVIFAMGYAEQATRTLLSEIVARDLRDQISRKLSRQSYAAIQRRTAAMLLTVITSDVDAVKTFVSMALITIASSAFVILGAGALLFSIDAQLAGAVLAVLPVIAIAFAAIFSRIGLLFKKAQALLDQLNKTINESILGAALVRILRSELREGAKFGVVNQESKDNGMAVRKLFASLFPLITFLGGMATLIILALGGRFVIEARMSLGDFTAFNSYAGMLIFPIIMIGFMSNLIGRAAVSYGRIRDVLDAPEPEKDGGLRMILRGDVELRGIMLAYADRPILKGVSIKVPAGSRMAIIGPTAAGKTQLLYLLTGLIEPDKGEVLYDGRPIRDYDSADLHAQIGFVFQDGVVFNMTLRENIAFNGAADDAAITKAIATAELQDFVDGHPDGLAAMVSERGTSLSGGQKQRLMLARALASSPKVLLLDDFTARVDPATEARILANIAANYPGVTVISITQKVASAKACDRVVLLMEGEVLAQGTHDELMTSSPEYVQIDASQRTTERL